MIDRAKMRLACPFYSSASFLGVGAYTGVSATVFSDGSSKFGVDYGDSESDTMTEISCHPYSVVLAFENGDNDPSSFALTLK
jgi:hypothetical protein